MRYTQIGFDRASVIGLGAWQFGAREWNWEESQRKESIRIVHRAIELGINVIDTAEIYGKGRSEEIVGEAIAGQDESVLLASKVFPLLPVPSRIRRAAKRSLERLRLTQIDLYQLHWHNPGVPLRLQMKGMRRLRDDGQIWHIGVSNFSRRQWQRAEAVLGSPVETNQVQYSLLQRKPENDLLAYTRDFGRVLIAYSPLAQGLLSGKYDVNNVPGDVRRFNRFFKQNNLQRALRVVDSLKEIAAKYDATPAQIALAWVVYHPNVIAIPGARSVSQVEENAAAADIRLSEDDYNFLSAAADRYRDDP